MSETSFTLLTCVSQLGVTVWSDVDGLVCILREYIGRVCGIVGSGQTFEYPVMDGLPLS